MEQQEYRYFFEYWSYNFTVLYIYFRITDYILLQKLADLIADKF